MWKWDGFFFAVKSVSRRYTVFMFVLIDRSDQFSRSMVEAPNFYRSAFTETDVHVWRECFICKCNRFVFFRLEISCSPVLFLCLDDDDDDDDEDDDDDDDDDNDDDDDDNEDDENDDDDDDDDDQ